MTTQREYVGPDRRSRPDHRDLIREIIEEARTTEEAQWVRLAIKREAQSIKLRQAIIEKTLSGLIWAAVIGLGVIFVGFLKGHGIDLTK